MASSGKEEDKFMYSSRLSSYWAVMSWEELIADRILTINQALHLVAGYQRVHAYLCSSTSSARCGDSDEKPKQEPLEQVKQQQWVYEKPKPCSAFSSSGGRGNRRCRIEYG
ncbi:hypothetical protein H0E87_019965 [Populus deltoides]|uniref:Uncharacterized protein n=1 Tax=Populus deltoides TaxID=3696 RepID=A0A8T2XXC3_POPDE|nr:hypothetical protein H0E87_019965 [Populus deltoides]